MARQLCENQLASVHRIDPRKGSSQGRTGACRSRNRDQKKSRFILGESICYGRLAQ
jgi:aminoglycoside phosphotransferase (APT) family kinase protein